MQRESKNIVNELEKCKIIVYNIGSIKTKGKKTMFNFGFSLASGIWGTVGMIAILFIVLYFFMIRPQKKKDKEDAAMRDALQVGDEVTTIGGIIGKVVSIKGETFVLETTKDKTKIRFLKGAIRSVDVRAADVAAQVMDAASAPADTAPAELAEKAEAPAKKKASKKKAEKAAPAVEEAPAIEEAPAVEEAPAEAAPESEENK